MENSRPAVETELQDIVRQELETCKAKIIERIAAARKLTDTEVYQAGVALNDVVNHAQSYMKDVEERMTMTSSDEGGVTAAVESIQRIAKTQEDLVDQALENLAGISKAGRQIQEMSSASRLLALNARVESSRFGGEGGRAFNVIADEMRELSQAVRTTNTAVSQLAGKLERDLPSIQNQTRSMSASIKDLVLKMSERNHQLQAVFSESISMGGEALESVLSSARRGLSHLQFQDLMIQDLEGIERVLGKSMSVVNATLGGTETEDAGSTFLGTIGAELDDREAPTIDAGDVLLF